MCSQKSSDTNVLDQCEFRTGRKIAHVGTTFARLLAPSPSLAQCLPAMHRYAEIHDLDQTRKVAKLWICMRSNESRPIKQTITFLAARLWQQ